MTDFDHQIFDYDSDFNTRKRNRLFEATKDLEQRNKSKKYYLQHGFSVFNNEKPALSAVNSLHNYMNVMFYAATYVLETLGVVSQDIRVDMAEFSILARKRSIKEQ